MKVPGAGHGGPRRIAGVARMGLVAPSTQARPPAAQVSFPQALAIRTEVDRGARTVADGKTATVPGSRAVHINEIDVDIAFRFHCPVTGELVAGPEHYGPSPATAFLLGPEADEFDHLAPQLEPIWEEVRAAHDEDERSPWRLFDEFCRRLEGHDNLVLFSLTSSGIACGPVSSTVHVCIDFSHPAADDGDVDADEEGDEGAAGEDSIPVAVVPLPRRIPLTALETLLAAYRHVARDVSGEPEYGPIDMLVGYRDLDSGEGFMAFEFEGGEGEEPCGPPLERLRGGETLAIQLHDGWLADGVELIDGKDYRPTQAEIRAAEALEESAGPDDPCLFPDDTGFYALGIGLDGEGLSIETIAVGCGMNGESLVRPAVFPESLRRRIAAFLARLA